jgi:hypothetical protein
LIYTFALVFILTLQTPLTPDPLTKYFKGLRINAYANGSGLKFGQVLST